MTADDRLEILDVVARWSHAADSCDVAAFERLLVDDAVLEVAGDETIVGRSAIAARATATPNGQQLRRHLRNTVIEDLDGVGALARSYYLLTSVVDGGRPSALATGVYVDELVHTEGWRIAHRTVLPDVKGDAAW